MRVGLFSYGMNTRLTGIGRYTKELAYHLSARYPEVEIVWLNPYRDSPLAMYRDFEQVLVPELVRLPLVLLRGGRILEKAASDHGLDILHDPCGIAPFTGMPTDSRRWRTVVTIHDAIPFVLPRSQPLLTRVTFETKIRKSPFTTDALLTVSQSAAQDLARWLKVPASRIDVALLGVTVADVSGTRRLALDRIVVNGSEIRHPYFLYVGDANPRKNLRRVLSAYEQLVASDANVSLVLVGPNESMMRSIDRLSSVVREKVVQTGFVDDAVLGCLYDNACALLYPSLYEGFGLPALEAMAHRTPVITTRVSSLPEVVGESAFFVDPRDTASILSAMQMIRKDPLLASSMAEAGYERAKTFTWEETAVRTMAVYRRLCSRGAEGEAYGS